MKKITVLIIEDSKLMQEILTAILSSDPDIKVISAVSDPLIAREIIKKVNPQVLTLDIMLPYMDGLTFLKNLMRLHPMPVVMISSLTEEDNAIALEALSIGAVDYLPKPSPQDTTELSRYAKDLIVAVKNAAQAHVIKNIVRTTQERKMEKAIYYSPFLRKGVIAIGASTGGIEAIETILMQLPQILPPIVIVQHIKKQFGSAFSRRIQKLFGLTVVEPKETMEILPGHIYVAPSEHHLVVKRHQDRYIASLMDGEPVSGHKPSIDVLFGSIASSACENCIGILLTGMGSDGAQGLKEIHNAGGVTIVQNEQSSVVWGMPGSAVKLKAVDYVLSLSEIPQKILQIIDGMAEKQR